ncbi:hypothetical protein E2562_000955 [Oryza meyeriana var. granulata]|uniref:Uncharacterized protein n=1 Tax=Oryza meyeriana var. granulata TaxID=110450 RepID=A0A6G1CYH3_9ORYZ|nr:hypothetical protein E2562_000955 [Oryza meyeriana var. granulata]
MRASSARLRPSLLVNGLISSIDAGAARGGSGAASTGKIAGRFGRDSSRSPPPWTDDEATVRPPWNQMAEAKLQGHGS